MNFLFRLFVCVFFAVVFYALLSLFRVAFVHIKAFFVRRKLSKLAETEKKDD